MRGFSLELAGRIAAAAAAVGGLARPRLSPPHASFRPWYSPPACSATRPKHFELRASN